MDVVPQAWRLCSVSADGPTHCLPCLQAMHFLIQKSGGVICVCMEDR